MVLAFGIRVPHCPTNEISLSKNISRLRFSISSVVASLHKAAFSYGWRCYVKLPLIQGKELSLVGNYKRLSWSIKSNADGRGLDPLTNGGDGRTRLLKTIQSLQIRLNERIQELRKDLPRKILFFLVGFYCATAFATVIGQTGDWDILSAAVAVAVVEAIGALMYKSSVPLLNKTKSLIVMFNYWKAGLTMGIEVFTAQPGRE